MRRASCVVALSFAVASAGTAGAATDLLKTSSGSPVHWTRARISVGLDPSASSRSVSAHAVERAIERAAATWNGVRSGQPRLYFALHQNADVRISFCQGTWRGDTIDLGRAQFTADAQDGSVTAASVEMNECDHVFKTADEGPSAGFDLQAVLTHELGHVLGLGHSTNPTTVMHPNGRGGAQNRRPNAEDQRALALLYLGRFTNEEMADTPAPATYKSRDLPVAAYPAIPTSPSPAAELVSLLRLTGNRGKEVMVYTCEPTVLPPLGPANARGRASPRSPRP